MPRRAALPNSSPDGLALDDDDLHAHGRPQFFPGGGSHIENQMKNDLNDSLIAIIGKQWTTASRSAIYRPLSKSPAAKSLKRAAERLLLTQPAMSRTLSELEEILGATLLERGRGGVALTAQGEFFGLAQASLSALERGLDGMQGFGPEARLRLRAWALPSVAARLMPEVMEDAWRAPRPRCG